MKQFEISNNTAIRNFAFFYAEKNSKTHSNIVHVFIFSFLTNGIMFTQNLLQRFIISHLTLMRFGIVTIQIMVLSEEQIISSTRKELLKTKT